MPCDCMKCYFLFVKGCVCVCVCGGGGGGGYHQFVVCLISPKYGIECIVYRSDSLNRKRQLEHVGILFIICAKYCIN